MGLVFDPMAAGPGGAALEPFWRSAVREFIPAQG
jgi:hypothetical protein